MSFTVFIGVGSNLGDRQKNCERAVEILKNHPRMRMIKSSKWIETKALTLPGETHPDFINGAVQMETDLTPQELLKTLKTIEFEMGRTPANKKWQTRVIDLDILFYGDQIIDSPDLKIPHPSLHERPFVLKPLAEIAPDWIHPILKKPAAALFQKMNLKRR